ncbi:MAG TPA: SRPBCC family protein [Candidatus Eisenbacteria bacterium]|nr:SRPBCC family protein [Candidatus Eisenbacteria bacterium]
MLAKILLVVAGLVVVFVAVVATRPSAYHVERNLEVAAPPDLVFGVLNDLRQFAGVLVLFGTPWEETDPGMQKTFEGPATGVGQSYAWDSKKEVGRGRMTIEESVPARKVGIKLEFVAPMKSTATFAFTLAEAPSGTLVTWSMDGNHNFLGKAFGLFMNMDKMLGADIEKGLARLKTAAESPRSAATAAAAPAGADTPAAP